MHTLILARHGESEHHLRDLTGGWTDTPLTDCGKQQAERIGHALAASGHATRASLIGSDLLRARQTAEIVSRIVGIPAAFHAELRELNNGIAKDKSRAEARRLETPVTHPTVDWIPYPGAESWGDMSRRITRFMTGLAARDASETTIVVSHGNAMIPIVHWWLGLGKEYWSRISFEMDCGSITRLTENRWGERVIAKLNDTAHLRT